MIKDIGFWALINTTVIAIGIKALLDSRKRDSNTLYVVKQFNKWNVYYINDEAIEKLLQCNTTQEIIKITEWKQLK